MCAIVNKNFHMNKGRKMSILVISIIFVVVIDMELSNVSDIISNKLSSYLGIVTFIVIASIYFVAQYFALCYVKSKSENMKKGHNILHFVNRTVVRVQGLLIFLFVFLTLEIILTSYYYVGILVSVVIATNLLNVVIMALLVKWMLAWYRTRKDSVVLLYAISCIMFAITACVSIMYVGNILSTKSSLISNTSSVFYPSFPPYSIMGIMNYIYYFLGMISYITVWIATALLLRYYSRRLGRIKYWVICSAPLAFFLGQFFVSILNLFVPIGGSSQAAQISFLFYYSIIFTLGTVLAGVLFGLPFWIIAKTVGRNNNLGNYDKLKDYLNICGYGMALFFTSGSATVLQTPYPPFGLITVSLIGISSYFILIGLYFSAISVSGDSNVRKTIRRFALEEAKMLDNIGFAQMENEIRNRVITFAEHLKTDKKLLPEDENEITISPFDSKTELNEYLHEVLEEVKKEKKSRADNY